MAEEKVAEPSHNGRKKTEAGKPQLLSSFVGQPEARMSSGIAEFDRVLGGGIVQGSLILVGGEPGTGKSTLLLMVAADVAQGQGPVLYVTGEESAPQTAIRAERTGSRQERLWVLPETDLEVILSEAAKMSPTLIVIDSIQTMVSPGAQGTAGSITQVREATGMLLRFAKERHISIIIIGHVTKDGNIAGPRLLEHMVDVVLYLEGERNYAFRILRSIKNRFGTTAESGIFSMESGGLVGVDNPSRFLLAERIERGSGSTVTACLEGVRPLLVEIQSLVSASAFGMPRRMTAGFDGNRLNLLLAVLEKRLGLLFGNQDVYVNAVGGFRLQEPAADLAVVMAVVSSFRDISVDPATLVIGEIGLTGEVRLVPGLEQRVREGAALGFTKVILPQSQVDDLAALKKKIRLIGVRSVAEAIGVVFG